LKPLCKIKVIPGKYSPFIKEYRHYYHVLIFENKQDMWNVGAKISPHQKDKNGCYGAITIPAWRERFDGDNWIKSPKIGTVLFYKALLGSEVISHEAVHMATSYLRITNELRLSEQIDNDEEKLAYCIGSCTRQIVDNLYKFNVL
jgi:hypothetical protein